jgi:hypothetical protein
MPPSRAPKDGGFDEYRMLILQTLETLERKIEALQDDITTIKVAVGQLQVRAGLLGALGGAIGGAVISALVAKVLQ